MKEQNIIWNQIEQNIYFEQLNSLLNNFNWENEQQVKSFSEELLIKIGWKYVIGIRAGTILLYIFNINNSNKQ